MFDAMTYEETIPLPSSDKTIFYQSSYQFDSVFDEKVDIL